MVFSLWIFTKYLRKVFETPLNDYIWLVERSNLFPRKHEKVLFSTHVLKHVFNVFKTIKGSIFSNIADLFYSISTQRALEGHSKSTWTLEDHPKGTPWALQGHLDTQGTQVFERFRHLGTQVLGHSRHLI